MAYVSLVKAFVSQSSEATTLRRSLLTETKQQMAGMAQILNQQMNLQLENPTPERKLFIDKLTIAINDKIDKFIASGGDPKELNLEQYITQLDLTDRPSSLTPQYAVLMKNVQPGIVELVTAQTGLKPLNVYLISGLLGLVLIYKIL